MKRKKKKDTRKIFFVWLSNTTDSRDDEPIKIKARTKKEAEEVAEDYLGGRFLISDTYTRKEFKKAEPWWHAAMWKWKAKNE